MKSGSQFLVDETIEYYKKENIGTINQIKTHAKTTMRFKHHQLPRDLFST